MQNRQALTRLEVVVLIIVVLFLLIVLALLPPLQAVHQTAQRVVCESHLKGLGTAIIVYGNDYGNALPCQGGEGRPAWATATDGWADPLNGWTTAQNITVGASLYILIRQANVNPYTFECPSSGEACYSGQNPNTVDYTDLWDFGQWTPDPIKDARRWHRQHPRPKKPR